MSPPAHRIWPGLLLLAACSSEIRVTDVPESVRWVALVELDEAGVPESASPLVRFGPNAALPIYASVDDAWLIGYGSELTPVIEGRNIQTDTAPLFAAQSCQTRLPKADWWAPVTQPPPEALLQAPRMTASWLPMTCSDPGQGGLQVHLSCVPVPCLIKTKALNACSDALDLSPCGIGSPILHRSPFGAGCLDTPKSWGCEPQAPTPEYAQVALSCVLPLVEGPTPCDITVYERTPAKPFALDGLRTETLELVNPERILRPDTNELKPVELEAEYTLFGVAYGLVGVDGQLWASHRSDGGLGTGCRTAGLGPPTALSRIDPEAMAVLSSVPTEACLQALLPDPGEGLFVGAHPSSDEASWQISRYDPQGRRLGSVSIPDSRPGEGWWLAGLLAFPERGTLLVATSGKIPSALRFTELSIEDLSIVRTSTFAGPAIHRLRKVDAETLLAARGDFGPPWTVLRLDLEGNELRSEELFEPTFRGDLNILDVVHHPASGLDVFSVGRDEPSVRVWKPPGHSRSNFYEYSTTQASGFVPWPANPNLLLMAGTKPEIDGGSTAILQLFDPAQGRLLPGAAPVGLGIVSEYVIGETGEIFLLLPWSGQLVKVTGQD